MEHKLLTHATYCPSFTLRDDSYIALESIVHETVVLRDLYEDVHMRHLNFFDVKEAIRKSYELPRGPRHGMPRTEIVFVSHATSFSKLFEEELGEEEKEEAIPPLVSFDVLQFHFIYNGPVSTGVVDILYQNQQISDIPYMALAEGIGEIEQKLKGIIHAVRCAEKGQESLLVRYWLRREPQLRSLCWETDLEATWCIPQERNGLLVHERTLLRRCKRAE